MLKFIVPFIATIAVERGISDINKLSSCTCLNDNTTYTCAVNGPGFTIWRGSAFDCQQNWILLRHMLFVSGTMGSCNDGDIVGRSLGVSENIYTSQITVSITSNLIGRIIECAYSLTGATITPINSTTIAISEPFPSPLGVKLTNVTTDHLTFQWSAVEFGSSCPTLQYSIETDCGNCSSNLQSATSVTCSFDLSSITDNVCSFSIRTVICSDIAGNFSEPIEIMLKVPTVPSVDVVPTYNLAGNLIRMNITFREVDSYRIFGEIYGSVLNYTLTFVHSSANITCNTTNILPSSCSNGNCIIGLGFGGLNLPCSGLANKSEDIMISVSASNVLGTGPTSDVSVGAINQDIEVRFEQVVNQSIRIVCIFPNETNVQSELSCKIEYKPCQELNMIFRAVGIRNSSNMVIINLSMNLELKTYCYNITASNGNYTIIIEDNIMTSSGPSLMSNNSQAIAIGVSVSVVVVIIILVIVAVLVVLKVKLQRTKGGHDVTTMAAMGEGASVTTPGQIETADGDETTPGEDATKFMPEEVMQIVKAHICFNLEDKPHQLLSALTSLTDSEILNKINIKNITIGPLQDEKRRIYIENENDLSDTDRESIKKTIAVDGHTPEELEILLESESKSIPTRTDSEDYQTHEISKVLKHQSGALYGFIDKVLTTDDCMHINITDITIKDEGTDSKHVTIKFVLGIEETIKSWQEKFERSWNEKNVKNSISSESC